MALLDMKRISLIAHSEQRNAILKLLQDIGAVEILNTSQQELSTAKAPECIGTLEKKLAEVRESLDIIRKYDDSKTSFLTPKPAISKSGLENIKEKFDEADKVTKKTKQFSDDMSSLKARRHHLKNKMIQLEPYAKFDAPLQSVCDGKYTSALLGTIPSDNKEKYKDIEKKFGDTAYFEVVGNHKDYLSVYVVMIKQVHEKLTGELKFIGFSEAYTKDLYGTPRDLVYDYQNEYESLGLEAGEYEEKAKKFVENKLVLKAVEDCLTNEIARERCVESLGETGSTFMLEGWIIADTEQKIEKALLETAPEAYISFRNPEPGEIPPTAYDNAKAITPFEAVTDMYSITSSKGIDPNFVMAIFYFLIFGMMMADLAYGIILTFGSLLVLKLKKPEGMFRKITSVIMICGISTALWGLFFGNIFSIDGLMTAVINPLQDAMSMLILCIGIGVVHILTGLGMAAYMNIRRGKILAALFDNVSWMIILIGAGMLALGGAIATVGMYMMILGAVVLLLTQGRHKKGIIGKAVGGLASLYDVTSYLSDILSYCRIFGMGLATTVIAMVFNRIAAMFFGGIPGYIIGAVILTIGHVFNIAINTLGAFVHTARLQYIEFFSKFYEGGGHTFKPLGIKTKHYRLDKIPR